jgi:hypothetical protein
MQFLQSRLILAVIFVILCDFKFAYCILIDHAWYVTVIASDILIEKDNAPDAFFWLLYFMIVSCFQNCFWNCNYWVRRSVVKIIIECCQHSSFEKLGYVYNRMNTIHMYHHYHWNLWLKIILQLSHFVFEAKIVIRESFHKRILSNS